MEYACALLSVVATLAATRLFSVFTSHVINTSTHSHHILMAPNMAAATTSQSPSTVLTVTSSGITYHISDDKTV